jgi:deazaflavin-dependent oxidoreductase (nitroreductase family)
MAGSHTPFVVVNRVVNPVVRAGLRSPAHRLLSGHLALLTVTGRRSGRTFTFPVGYQRDGDRVTVGVDWPERKRWWRNLLEAARVEIRLAGVRRTGTGQARGDEHTGVTVEIQLDGAAGSPPAA